MSHSIHSTLTQFLPVWQTWGTHLQSIGQDIWCTGRLMCYVDLGPRITTTRSIDFILWNLRQRISHWDRRANASEAHFKAMTSATGLFVLAPHISITLYIILVPAEVVPHIVQWTPRIYPHHSLETLFQCSRWIQHFHLLPFHCSTISFLLFSIITMLYNPVSVYHKI